MQDSHECVLPVLCGCHRQEFLVDNVLTWQLPKPCRADVSEVAARVQMGSGKRNRPSRSKTKMRPEDNDKLRKDAFYPSYSSSRAEMQNWPSIAISRNFSLLKDSEAWEDTFLARQALGFLLLSEKEGTTKVNCRPPSNYPGRVSCCDAGTSDSMNDSSYLHGLDDESALRCLAQVSRSVYWKLSLVNQRYRGLLQSSLLFEIRQLYGTVEQWICMYTSGNDGWTAFDPKQNTWRNLPRADVDPFFYLSDRESLSAGTHLLWLGREAFDSACYKYDFICNSWEKGPAMVTPRCLFASASCGEFAYVAGGFTAGGMCIDILSSAERYDSRHGRWHELPPMATPRQKCSGVVMDGKFYVIGGKDRNHQPITSSEEYDITRGTWRTIENMYSRPLVELTFEPSPPLVAVANNELYAIESSANLLKHYQKGSNTWKVLGAVPVRADSCNGWGLAFKALGDELFVVGGHRASARDPKIVAVFSWKPSPDASAADWQLVNSQSSGKGTFLFNCAVMSC